MKRILGENSSSGEECIMTADISAWNDDFEKGRRVAEKLAEIEKILADGEKE